LLKHLQRLPTTKVIIDHLPRGQVAGQVALVNAALKAVSAGCADGFEFVEGAFEDRFDDCLLFGRWV
jgi:hypothetical protein